MTALLPFALIVLAGAVVGGSAVGGRHRFSGSPAGRAMVRAFNTERIERLAQTRAANRDTNADDQRACTPQARPGLGSEESLEKLLLTVEETASLIGIGRTKVFELIATGALESVGIGGARRVPTAAVTDYVERLRARAGGAALKGAS